MATPRPQISDFDTGPEYAMALRDWEAANAVVAAAVPAPTVATPAPVIVPAAVPTFADNPGQARIQAQPEAAPAVVAPADVSSISDLYYNVGGRVTGSVQSYVDEVYAGAQSGKYTIEAAQNALNIVNQQAEQGMTGGGGAALGVIAPTGGGDDGGDDGGSGAGGATTGNGDIESATSILQSVLKFYGMDDAQLVTDVRTALAERRLTGTSTVDDIGIQLRESAAFKERFSGNEARRAAGKPAYSVSQYLQLESSYRNTMLAAGLPPSFYNDKDDFANFIANDVSPDEIQDRVSKGFAAINNAPQNVIDEFQTLYGVDKNELAAYFLDPVRAKEIVIRKAEAAKIASQARQQANISLGATQAELLAQQGITEQQAQTGFGLVLQGQKLTQPLQGEDALTQEELIAGTFGTNAAAAQRVAQTRRKRKGTFESGGTLAAAKVQQENIGLSTVGQ